jgi:protein SCO1
VFASVAACGLALAACSSTVGPPSASVGAVSHRKVPSRIADLALVNQSGQDVSLAGWKGKTVVLVPFLTLCADVCPMTTGVLLQVEQSLKVDHVGSKVEIVELSVDPARDTPARLAAYAHLTGAQWELVTESAASLSTLASWFGIFYEDVPEGTPPDIDWLTGQPLTYDVDHSDGFIVIDPSGYERFVTDASPDFHGRLNPSLKQFLSPLGRQHLADPPKPGYRPADVLAALSWVMHRNLALAQG